jgi:methionine-rich copper-binding protein CopC
MVIKAFTTKMSDDGKTLTLALRKPLPAGSYTVKWSATGVDRNRVVGTLDFAVE